MEFVNNEVDPTAGTIALRAVFENKDRLLVPGDFVNVTATAKTPVDVTVVPQVAVSDSTNGSYVWVVDENNKAQQRFIKQTEDFIQSQLKKGVNGGVYATPFAS